jgi:hypothetical protein
MGTLGTRSPMHTTGNRKKQTVSRARAGYDRANLEAAQIIITDPVKYADAMPCQRAVCGRQRGRVAPGLMGSPGLNCAYTAVWCMAQIGLFRYVDCHSIGKSFRSNRRSRHNAGYRK